MIFQFHFTLIMAGYSAVGILFGSYMMHYAGASELDLGFVFMIQPLTIFARPFICAQADRYQTHQKLLALCALISSMSYLPYLALPFLLRDYPELEAGVLNVRLRFWALVVCHMVGSLGFCGCRSLGDALACNYAKRVNSDFTMYRKYGAISFGVCGLLLGRINQNWILPDFVPSFILYIICFLTLSVLVYAWPEEYFTIKADEHRKSGADHEAEVLPSCSEVLRHVGSKLLFCCGPSKSLAGEEKFEKTSAKRIEAAEADRRSSQVSSVDSCRSRQIARPERVLTMSQQLQIFAILLRRDIRIPSYLLLIVYGGLVGYAPQNFVFTYLNEYCHERGICDAASLSGIVMICFCTAETVCYFAINSIRHRLNHLYMLTLTLVSLMIHYYFYGFLLVHLSPYFFIVESMHGFEYGASLASCVELGYRFANEVEYIIPELVQRGIISKHDDRELVKVSLMATMSGCFTLAYDGVGTIVGSFIYGVVTDHYSFTTTWILIGSLATIGVVVVILAVAIGKCLNIQPQIYKLMNEDQRASA